MNVISLFQSLVNHLSNILENNLFLHELDHNISNSNNELNLDILKQILEYLEYKNSKERKSLYYVQQTRERTLITSLGLLTFNKTYYKSKKIINGKYKYYSYLEDYLGIAKWAKMTLASEVILINNTLDSGYSWSANNSIPNYITARQTISSKIQSINYNYVENISKKDTPEVIYIEDDEVHANLQSRDKGTKNRILSVILTHEGHKEVFFKKKKLKEQHYIASSILKTDKVWNEAYKYLDTKYDLDKEPLITSIADSYLRNKMIDESKLLINVQIEKYQSKRKI